MFIQNCVLCSQQRRRPGGQLGVAARAAAGAAVHTITVAGGGPGGGARGPHAAQPGHAAGAPVEPEGGPCSVRCSLEALALAEAPRRLVHGWPAALWGGGVGVGCWQPGQGGLRALGLRVRSPPCVSCVARAGGAGRHAAAGGAPERAAPGAVRPARRALPVGPVPGERGGAALCGAPHAASQPQGAVIQARWGGGRGGGCALVSCSSVRPQRVWALQARVRARRASTHGHARARTQARHTVSDRQLHSASPIARHPFAHDFGQGVLASLHLLLGAAPAPGRCCWAPGVRATCSSGRAGAAAAAVQSCEQPERMRAAGAPGAAGGCSTRPCPGPRWATRLCTAR